MTKIIIGKKIGMTRKFSEGISVPLTLVKIHQNNVLSIRKNEKDRYSAICVGAGTRKKNKISKPLQGQAKNLKNVPVIIREMKIDDTDKFEAGTQLSLDQFKVGDTVQVTGTSKGKGYAGVIKRHGFRRGPETHGSDHHRATGSIGGGYPQRVVKGRKMPGHMGSKTITQTNTQIIDIITDENLLVLRGSIPGANNSWVVVKS